MNAQDFAFWLKGFSELTDKKPTKEQWQIIQDHLDLVFTKITPDRSEKPLTEKEGFPIVNPITPNIPLDWPRTPSTIEPWQIPGITCEGDNSAVCSTTNDTHTTSYC